MLLNYDLELPGEYKKSWCVSTIAQIHSVKIAEKNSYSVISSYRKNYGGYEVFTVLMLRILSSGKLQCSGDKRS